MSDTAMTSERQGGATTATQGDDLSTLSWVQAELRRSLEAAHKALRRQLKEHEAAKGSDLGSVDPAVLRTAKAQFHQGAGALVLVGQAAAAEVLRTSEAVVVRMAARPAMVDAAAIDTLERASFALLDFLARQLAGKPVSPVQLFPQYRALRQLAGAERAHPADLWPLDWQWHPLPAAPGVEPLAANDAARSRLETQVLALMRPAAPEQLREQLAAMGELCASLGAGALASSFGGAHIATFWQLAAAVFEAQAQGLLDADVYTKRIASGLLAQLRQQVKGAAAAPERSAQDLLFFCSHARVPADPATAPRLMAVRRAWQLDLHPTANYESTSLGRFDPAVLALARKRVGVAKESWSAVAGGEMHRATGLPEQFTLMGESLQRLFPQGEVLAQALQTAVGQSLAAGGEPGPSLAMEVATAILYVDASLEDAQFDHPALADRILRLARRIDDVRIGADPQPLEPWMEELYRRVSDRQTMGSVVQELRASLSEVEKQIDQYFRNPERRDLLIPVPGQLSAMRGVLSVLGMDQASNAALRMRDDVEALAQTEVDPQQAIRAGTFDRLADNLGALSFLIDMLSVQPQLAKSLFRFDADSGSLSAVMGQSERVSAFAAFDVLAEPATTRLPPTPPAAPVQPPERPPLVQLSPAPVLVPAPATPALPTPPAAADAGVDSGLEDDAEMREIFIEEAHEVIAEARAALERLADASDHAGDLTTVRRAFHTLKGSARMVGLRAFGEAGWACEQLYNDRLASAPRMDHALRAFTAEALAYLAAWTEAIAHGDAAGYESAAVSEAAEALRLRGERLAIPAASRGASAQAPAVADAPLANLAGLADGGPERLEAVETLEPVEPFESLEALALPDVLEAPETPPPAETLAGLEATQALPEPTLRLPDLPSLDLPSLDLSDETVPEASARPLPLAGPPAASPPAVEAIELDFDLLDEVDFGTDAGAFEKTLPLDALQTRVPDLPSAADLDFGATAEPASGPADLGFDLDLDALEAPEPEHPVQATVVLPHGPDSDSLLNLPLDLLPPPLPQAANDDPVEEEQIKLIGPLRISIPLFNIFLNEADELSRRLCTELAEWALECERHPVPESAAALAHALAGNSATVGYAELSALARALEHALMRSHAQGVGEPEEARLFGDAADDIRHLLHQFAAGFLRSVEPGLMDRLAAHERRPRRELPEPEDVLAPLGLAEAPAEPAATEAVVDQIDPDLFPIFEEEAEELLPQLQTRLREWHGRPDEADAMMACMRTLHTLKGGARLAGAMRLGEMAHHLESAIEALGDRGGARAAEVLPLLAEADAMSAWFDAMRHPAGVPPAALTAPPAAAVAVRPAPAQLLQPEAPVPMPPAEAPAAADAEAAEAIAGAADEGLHAPVAAPTPQVSPETPPAAPAPAPAPAVVHAPVAIDWRRFASAEAQSTATATADRLGPGPGAVVRVRAGLLDRLVNQAGEVSITRARIDSDVKLLQGSLGELTESLERMRRQLRDIEVQAETQITTRIEAAKAAAQTFDPLEMDRFTRFQELTRFMAESVNDVATLQRSLQRTLQSTEDELAAQARLTRELQDDLLRTRMIEFDSIAERLYRTARQAAKDTGKEVKVDIVGGAIEIDRGVLERMVGSFEHLLRNSVAHGVEAPEARTQAGKAGTGQVTITVAQAGNEVAVEFADDGAGLNLARIRQRGIERGLLKADAQPSDADLAGLIFAPGFSTAETVTELAGRGVGLDVVRAEVNAMGGRVETASRAGQGTNFKLLLPLTTAVTQVVMLRGGDLQVAVPSPLIELVRRMPSAEVAQAYDSGHCEYNGEKLPFFWLPTLLRHGHRGPMEGRTQPVVIVRSAAQRVAVHVDEVMGNQEVVVKNVGPQLARMPGLAGVTLLPSGAVALIYNPVALASLYGEEARLRQAPAVAPDPAQSSAEAAAGLQAPLVMVVDDSLTVRRVTQRMLLREGYRVVLAKDGLDALDRLTEERPKVLLSDIEMPRMDGFDLVRNLRAMPELADLPVVMITSRIAQKHRDYAAELGVQHYLGKPYSEEELLALVARYTRAAVQG